MFDTNIIWIDVGRGEIYCHCLKGKAGDARVLATPLRRGKIYVCRLYHVL